MDQAAVSSHFHQFFLEAAEQRFKDIGCAQPVTIVPCQTEDADNKEWVAMIRLAGHDFKFSLRSQFNRLDAGSILAQKLGSALGKDYLLGCDIMKEYCNLLTGTLRNALLDLSIENKLSVPMVLKKNLDSIFVVRQSSIIFEHAWLFTWGKRSVFCSYAFEVLNPQILQSLKAIKMPRPAIGGIEFL